MKAKVKRQSSKKKLKLTIFRNSFPDKNLYRKSKPCRFPLQNLKLIT